MNEKTTCGRRMTETGPWEYKENIDTWDTNHWTYDEIPLQSHFVDGKQVVDSWQVGWVWPWIPRSCSFCGSVHPDDAFKLLDEGWELEVASGKNYKAYLNPPGSCQQHNAVMNSLAEGRSILAPSIKQPVPPVKLYMQHCSKEQVDKLNALAKVTTC